jgi:hypothetical protein
MILESVALLYLIPSVWQIFRESILIFTAILAVLCRRQTLLAFHWTGVCVTILGLSAILDEASGDVSSSVRGASVGMQIAAMGFLTIAQALQAFQTVVEEHLPHDVSATASEVCAFEGFWGLHLQIFIATPLAGDGPFEHTIESFQIVFGSRKLVGMVIGDSLNMTGMIVTALSTAVHWNIYEALRSVAVWVLSVVVHYTFPDSGAGEHLNYWSFLEAFGFIVSIFGSFLYNKVVRLPCFDYRTTGQRDEEKSITDIAFSEYSQIV